MYYHSRELKHIICGKVYPPKEEYIDEFYINAYKWLSTKCGFYPQIWLSRSKSCYTGYKIKNKDQHIMFGFECIQGFPLDYENWCLILGRLSNCKDSIKNGDAELIKDMNEMLKIYKEDNLDLKEDKMLEVWSQTKDLSYTLKQTLFIENDQVVVPSLNLKSAKAIYCRNEKQKKALRKMGFIEDRIKILNSHFWQI
jgi:hypothetical protein